MRAHLLAVLALLGVLLLPSAAFPPTASAATCQFVLGFESLHDAIPAIVGDCTTNEYHNPANGDGIQETTAWHGDGGLLVWRKCDNWTAFTDGTSTWVNGPYGIQRRPNAERFAFERDTCSQAPLAPAAARVGAFAANPRVITQGTLVTLSYNVQNADRVKIEGEGTVVQDVPVARQVSDSVVVAPSSTAPYTLTASNGSGSTTAVVNVTVVPALAVPVQVSPAAGTTFGHTPRTTTLRWSSVLGAASYTVEVWGCQPNELCADGSGQPWVLRSGLTTTSYTFEWPGAQPGRWRVWAVDSQGREGPRSAWSGLRYAR